MCVDKAICIKYIKCKFCVANQHDFMCGSNHFILADKMQIGCVGSKWTNESIENKKKLNVDFNCALCALKRKL